nr:MAG TPA: hypothetical protein [Caudoviricetes sp.]
MKNYNVYYSGGSKITTVKASCVIKACKAFMEQFNKPYKIEKYGYDYVAIRFCDNYSICSDYVVISE